MPDRYLVLLLLGAAACASSSPASGPVPTNVRGVRIAGGATLSWDPAPGATGYMVHSSYLLQLTGCGKDSHSCPRYVSDYPVPPGATSYTLKWFASFQVHMFVTATSASGDGPPSEELSFSDSGLGGNATVEVGSVQLQWQDRDLALGPTTIRRSAGGGEPVTIASSVPAGDYTDSTVEPDTRYSYQLIAETADSRVQEMMSLDVRTRLVAPGMTLVCDPGRAVLVTAVADAADYLVGTSSTPDGPYQFVFVSPGRVDPGCSSACYLVAVAVDASGVRGATSPEIHMDTRPTDIDISAAEMRVGRVRLSWPPSQGAARYDIYRADPAAGRPDAALASTSQTSFDDATGLPFHSYRYWVAGISADGCGSSILGLGSLAFSTTAPEQMSAGASPVPGAAPLARQTFTVGQSGQLMGIELGAAGEDPIYGVRPIPSVTIRKGPFLVAQASLLWAPSAPGAIPLAADEVRGIIYDLSGAGLLVSAGEHLAIEIADGPGYLVTDDAYAGGSIAPYGVADSARDLQFKTFVVPASASGLQLTAQGGDRGIALQWTAVPGAISYEVLEVPQGTTVGSAADTSMTIGGLDRASLHSYVARAHLAGGGTLDSPPASASTAIAVTDQANAGLGGGDSTLFTGPGWIAQSFTAGMAGTLAGIEVAVSPLPSSPFLALDLLDGSGNVLGSGTLATSSPTTASGLFSFSSAVLSGRFFDFSALGLRLTPGMVLSVRLTGSNSAFLDTPDAYPGGSESLQGPAGGARDLVFRSWVVPDN